MITKTGRNIIGKYLLGNAQAYASYIALGCGAKPGNTASDNITKLQNCYSEYWLVPGIVPNTDYNPRKIFIVDPTNDLTDKILNAKVTMENAAIDPNDVFDNNGRFSQTQTTTVVAYSNDDYPQDGDPNLHYKSITVNTDLQEYLYQGNISLDIDLEKNVMDFEMFRVPISSRGYITEDGINKIVLVGELPTEERYEISEIGIYSAGSNDEAGAYDSKSIFTFSEQENWQISVNGINTAPSTTSIVFPIILDKITDNDDNFISKATDSTAIQTNSNNTAFYSAARESRYERTRYLSNTYLTNGANSHLLNSKTFSGTLSNTTTATVTVSSGGLVNTNTFVCTATTGTITVGQSVTVTTGTGAFPANTYVTAIDSNAGFLTITLSANISTSLSVGAIVTCKSSQITGLTSTTGLYAGLELAKIGGTGVFGGWALITNVDSGAGTITLQTKTANTSGTMIFLVKDSILNISTTSSGATAIPDKHLLLNTQNIDLTRNSSSDLLKLAFSVINRDSDSQDPNSVRIAIKFLNDTGDQWAILGVEALDEDYDFGSNRYLVIDKMLSELEYSEVFSWNAITKAQVYSSVLRTINITNKQRTGNQATLTSVGHKLYVDDIVTIYNIDSNFNGTYVVSEVTTDTFSYLTNNTGTIASASCSGIAEASTKDFWVALDALRLENVSTNNPLYGLVGYSVVSGTNTLVKSANSTNYIEFRFALDVL